MNEREGPNWPGEGKPVAAEVSERLRSILADAESAADAIRHQAESDAQARRHAAETDALKIIEDARREAERFLADRIHRVSELSDEILERGQSVVERLDEAEQVRADLAGLVRALGETAARLANEVRAMPGPRAPDLSAAAYSAPPAEAARAPEPAPAPEPAVERAPDPEPEPAPGPDSEATPTPAPHSDPEVTEPAPDPPLVEPTPLRRGPIEPNELLPAAAADPEPEAEADAAPQTEPAAAAEATEAAEEPAHEPTPEEIELLERVRAAERERTAGEDEGADSAPEVSVPAVDTNGTGDGDRADLVEVAAAPDDAAAEAERGEAPAGPDQALGARLVALQMAVAGGNRGEVEAHLRRAFELDEPGAILDDIFGSGTDSDKRVVWPEAG